MNLLVLLLAILLVVILWPFVKGFAIIVIFIAAVLWLLGNAGRRF